jgi:hypothetical protein
MVPSFRKNCTTAVKDTIRRTETALPSDWYLRLTGEGTKLIRGERKNQRVIPMNP